MGDAPEEAQGNRVCKFRGMVDGMRDFWGEIESLELFWGEGDVGGGVREIVFVSDGVGLVRVHDRVRCCGCSHC